MMNKRGFITEFFALIVIVAIAGLFLIFGKISTTFEKEQGGLVVLDEDDVEIMNMFDYVSEYVLLVEEKIEIARDWEVGG